MKYVIVAALLAVSACAEKADKIAPAYVAASPYMKMDCEELYATMSQSKTALGQLSMAQNRKANTDAAMVTVGVVLFWPALLATSGTLAPDDYAGQISVLKGEVASMEMAFDAKCKG